MSPLSYSEYNINLLSTSFLGREGFVDHVIQCPPKRNPLNLTPICVAMVTPRYPSPSSAAGLVQPPVIGKLFWDPQKFFCEIFIHRFEKFRQIFLLQNFSPQNCYPVKSSQYAFGRWTNSLKVALFLLEAGFFLTEVQLQGGGSLGAQAQLFRFWAKMPTRVTGKCGPLKIMICFVWGG